MDTIAESLASVTDTTSVASPSTSSILGTPTAGGAQRHVNRRLFGHRRQVSDQKPMPIIADIPVGSAVNFSDCVPTIVYESTITHPFLSPLVVRKELENVLARDDMVLNDCRFASTHPTLYWNLVYYFRRLGVPSHLCHWLISDAMNEVWGIAESATESVVFSENERRLLIRCVFDLNQLHDEHCFEPLYQTVINSEVPDSMKPSKTPDATPVDDKLLLWSDRSMSLTTIHRIVESMQSNNLYQALQLLIKEYNKKARGASGSSAGAITTTLPRHNSMYRDLLFLALQVYGRAVRRDDFDREYANAFARLPPAVVRVLPCADRVPRTPHTVCAKIFMPLDVV